MLQSIAEEVSKQEHSYGNTQIMLDPWSSAALSLNMARGMIQDAHLEGTGKDVDPNHITVRFGLLNDDVDVLRAFLASQTPFEVTVGGTELFPASEHSDGAVPVVARMEGPGLHALEAAIGGYADFKEKSFPVYKPHCTLAYCKPEEAEQYASLPVGGTCLVHAVMISHASGVKETISFGIANKFDESKHPRDKTGRWTEAPWVARMRETLPVAEGFGKLPPPKFILPDGTLLTSGGGLHEEAAKKAGAPNLETVLKDGVMRIIVQRGKVMAMSIGAAVTSKQIQTVVDNTEEGQELFVDAGTLDDVGSLAYDSKSFWGRTLKAGIIEQWVNKHYTTTKKDPISGRYVTPFVSFDKQGDEQLRMIASLNSSRLATWGFTAEAEVLGMARYRLTAVLDGRTSKFCRMIDGKIFDVTDAREKVIEVLNVQDPNDLRVVQPWPKQDKLSMAMYSEMSAEELTERGLHIPPYHPHCRTLCRSVESSKGKSTEVTATVPAEVEVFQPVTAEDLKEIGVIATPEQVAEWNANIGMSPVELMTKLTGERPQDVMTQGVGSKPVVFHPSGDIGLNARGVTDGLEFKLGAILDPFTGIFYLTRAELEAGTPKAEANFLKRMFSTMLEMGKKSTASSIALSVAGNAAYYAKLGFLPDELEWDDLRNFSLAEIETGALQPMMASLAPADALLVKQLLQDASPSALVALAELPFTYAGKTVGEWILGETAGIWALDLVDDLMVAQAKAYLS